MFSTAYKKASLDLFAVLIFNFPMFAFGAAAGRRRKKPAQLQARVGTEPGSGEYRKPLPSM
jgi:hypothetical protein